MSSQSFLRLKSLLDGLNPAIRLDIATGLAYGILHADLEVLDLTKRVTKILVEHLNDRSDHTSSLPSIALFVEGAAGLLALGPSLRALDSDPEKHMEKFFDVLDRTIDAHFRYRLYTIHPEENCYKGLLSRGMESSYVETFDIRKPSEFGKTKEIRFSEPPYERINQTCCYRLSEKDLPRIPEQTRSWYKDNLGLGTVVPETYTWEFTEHGLADDLCINCSIGKEKYVFALSLDMGKLRSKRKDRVCDPLSIRLLDLLFKSRLGAHLAVGISGAQGYFLVEKMHEPRLIPTKTAGRSADVVKIQRLGEATLQGRFKAIPGGDTGEPWVFAEDDTPCENLYQLYHCFKRADSTLSLEGPSGVGKELIARALHFNGPRRDGPFFYRNYQEEDAKQLLIYLYGCEKGAFTDGLETPSDFEEANHGTYFIDEFYFADMTTQKCLLGLVDKVKKGIGFHRRGAQDRKTGKARQGRHVSPDVRVIFAGDRDQGAVHSHMRRRVGSSLSIPSWADLNYESRIVIMRWHLISSMAKKSLAAGRVSHQFFQYVIGNPPPDSLLQVNMDLVDWLDRLALLSSENGEAEFSLQRHIKGTKESSIDPRIKELMRGSETFPDSLRLGEGSEFARQLNKFEEMVVKIAKCKNEFCDGCVTLNELSKALRSLGKVEKPSAFDAHYLLLAAVSDVSTGDPSDDPFRTAPEPLLRHFQERSEYQAWFKETTSYNPGAVKLKGTEANAQFLGGPDFKTHVLETNIEVLLTKTERIACAFPPFLQEVPYWRANARRKKRDEWDVQAY